MSINEYIMRLAGFSVGLISLFLTLSPLSPFCSELPLYHMAWVGRGGSGLVGRNGRLGCRGGHGHMLVVGWGCDSCCSGWCRFVRSCASCCSFSSGIVASVCIVRIELE